MPNPYARAEAAADVIRTRLSPDLKVAVVLGSGWVGVAEGLGSTVAEMPLAELPHVPAPTVAGHSGVARAVDVGGVATCDAGQRAAIAGVAQRQVLATGAGAPLAADQHLAGIEARHGRSVGCSHRPIIDRSAGHAGAGQAPQTPPRQALAALAASFGQCPSCCPHPRP